ncbi:MAG: hypothetical protein ACEQSE_04165 [Candidatus Aquirickettsiella gammari]
MKIKYPSFAIFSLILSANICAQSPQATTESITTSSASQLKVDEIKRGPLADFYELIGQYQLPKKEVAQTLPKQTELPSKLTPELIADTKNPLMPKP